jgi:formate-dependent nitrite reductase membrane component NrfD
MKLLSSLFAAQSGPAVRQEAPQGSPLGRRGRRGIGKTEFTSYYGRPILKKPHWVWPVWTYFWLGGVAGGASTIAALADLFGDKELDKSIVRAGRYVSLAGMMVSPVLLIIDLQRPERFLHMLRVVKLKSPLNVGTYILTITGLLSGFNAARQVVEDGFIPEESLPGKLAILSSSDATQVLQGVAGLGLGGYTGVLLSATAVPLWGDNSKILPPLFLSSAFATGAAAITLVQALGGASEEEMERLDGIEQVATLSELALMSIAAAKLKPEMRKAIGNYRFFFLGAMLEGVIAPLLLKWFGPKHGQGLRVINIIRAVLTLGAGYMLRFAVIEAGKATAQDPDSYHAITQGRARPTPEEQARQGQELQTKATQAI